MKKLFALLAFLTLAVVLSSCGTKTAKYELAMITDVGTIDDKSFNQGTWEGLVKYADEQSISHKYYKPSEGTTQAYIAAIDLAVKGGAKIVVTPGFLFESAIYTCQDKYPNVTFILIDGTPHNEDYSAFKTGTNVYSIVFAEDQSGFLAGYAAVKEGFTKLGFMGGMAVPAVIRYGYGYLQGANVAATEMGLADGSITVKYNYLGGFSADPAYQQKAAGWYTAGTEVIFAAAGGAGGSVMSAAAAQTDKYVIGVDVDQASQSVTVITSAKKELSTAVYDCLTANKNNVTTLFVKGTTVTLDATNNGVGLPSDFSRFPNQHFTSADYTTLFNSLVNNTGNIRTNIINDTTKTVPQLGLAKLTVTEVE